MNNAAAGDCGSRESELRRIAVRLGVRLVKDRSIKRSARRQGGFMVVDARHNVVAGRNFEISLDQLEAYLRSMDKEAGNDKRLQPSDGPDSRCAP